MGKECGVFFRINVVSQEEEKGERRKGEEREEREGERRESRKRGRGRQEMESGGIERHHLRGRGEGG